MRRYLFRRKGLFFLTLTAILFFNLISAECSILKQKLVDAVLEPEADNVLWYMLFVLGANILYGLFYMAYQLLQNAFSVTVIDDMRKSIFLV